MGLFDNLNGAAPETTTENAPVNEQSIVQEGAAEAAAILSQGHEIANTTSQTQNTPPPAEAPASSAESFSPEIYTSLDSMSGGLIKDEATFKEFFPKVKGYDTLKKDHDDLAARMAQAPVFADDEVRILNELKRAGASKEQIKSFQKINDYGTLSEMSDRDALVANLVMNGTKPSVAEMKVDRTYKFGNEDLDSTEREELDDDARIAGLQARTELEKYKTAASQATNIPAEELQLQQTAALMDHQSRVKPYAAEIASLLPHFGTYNLSGKDGDGAVNYEVPIDAAQKAMVGQYVENYFMDGLTPVTEASTREAVEYARAEILKNNFDSIAKGIYAKAVAITTEQLTNKYENRSGIKPQLQNPIINGGNSEQQTASFMQRVANRQVG